MVFTCEFESGFKNVEFSFRQLLMQLTDQYKQN